MNGYVSKCCRKPLKVEGEGITHFYSCTGCGEGTNPVKKEAIVGVNLTGNVRALFCIDSDQDEQESHRVQAHWEKRGRKVYRCSQEYAFKISGEQWVEEPA